MSKEESLIPSVEESIGNFYRAYFHDIANVLPIGHVKSIMKAYGQEVRRIALQEVAKDHPEISHELHLLKESDRLKIT